MNVQQALDIKFCHSSYRNPIVDIDGWRLFMNGFIPSYENTKLICFIQAWKNNTPRYYGSLVGTDNGAFEYKKGEALPEWLVSNCVINAFALRDVNIFDFVEKEINLALDRLITLVCSSEGIDMPPRVVRIPNYEFYGSIPCPCCDQPIPDRVLENFGLR